MIWKNAKRVYSTKLNWLLNRPNFNNCKYEFLRKMTDNEINIYLNEVKNQLKIEGILMNNLTNYNNVFNSLLKQREEIFLLFKQLGHDTGDDEILI